MTRQEPDRPGLSVTCESHARLSPHCGLSLVSPPLFSSKTALEMSSFLCSVLYQLRSRTARAASSILPGISLCIVPILQVGRRRHRELGDFTANTAKLGCLAEPTDRLRLPALNRGLEPPWLFCREGSV